MRVVFRSLMGRLWLLIEGQKTRRLVKKKVLRYSVWKLQMGSGGT